MDSLKALLNNIPNQTVEQFKKDYNLSNFMESDSNKTKKGWIE